MSAPAFTAIASFQVVLCCKYPVSLLRPIKVALFNGYYFLHVGVVFLKFRLIKLQYFTIGAS